MAAADDAGLAWSELPDGARSVVIALAARALGSLPPDQVPSALASVARFTPAKRARLGAGPLARALEQDPGFRALAAQQVAGEQGGDSAAARGDAGSPPGGDPLRRLARCYLLRLPRSQQDLDAAVRIDEVAGLRRQVAELTDSVNRMSAQLARVSSATPPGLDGPHAGRARGSDRKRATPGGRHHGDRDGAEPDEVDRLRRRLREQGTRVRDAERAALEEVRVATAAQEAAELSAERERSSAENWRRRAQEETNHARRLQAALDRLSAESGQQRADADRRLDLLLDAVTEAAAGLRREWHLAVGGDDPADVVARDLPDVDAANRRSADPALLIDWLGIPGAHLIVDGYNVTKTGYPELSLADQRDRLARSLAALTARTGAEATVVFDGAAVVVTAAPSPRRVRVMFSPPGVIADDVIRRLAAAEPRGRMVVVVSSDREVVDGVRASGARTAPSAVLLAALG